MSGKETAILVMSALATMTLLACTYKPGTVSGAVYQCPESLLKEVNKKLEECKCQKQ